MKSYLAHEKRSGLVFGGGLHACLNWSFRLAQQRQNAVINILIIRPKTPARVIGEIDHDGGRWVFGGRTMSANQVNKLMRRASNG